VSYVFFLSDQTRNTAILDKQKLVERLRNGLIRETDEIYLPETREHITAAELMRRFPQAAASVEMPSRPGASFRLPPAIALGGTAVGASSPPPSSARPAAPAPPAPVEATPSRPILVDKHLRDLAQVPQSEYYEQADRLFESYVRQYQQNEGDIVRALLCVPLLGYGFVPLSRALKERSALLRRVAQAGFLESVVRTAIVGTNGLVPGRRRGETPLIAAATVAAASMIVALIGIRWGIDTYVLRAGRPAVNRAAGMSAVAASGAREAQDTRKP